MCTLTHCKTAIHCVREVCRARHSVMRLQGADAPGVSSSAAEQRHAADAQKSVSLIIKAPCAPLMPGVRRHPIGHVFPISVAFCCGTLLLPTWDFFLGVYVARRGVYGAHTKHRRRHGSD